MPVNPGLRTLIEINVVDRTFGDTTIKQKAIFNSLYHVQKDNGECSAIINVTVKSYASDKGNYGASLSDLGVPDRFIQLTADNNSLVDATNGTVLVTRKFETNADWDTITNGFTQQTMLQGDFFEMIREKSPIEIGGLIRQHIGLADAPPFSRFS